MPIATPGTLSEQQGIQEDQYGFPYHYLSVHDRVYERVLHRHYLSLLSLVRELVAVGPGQSLLDAGCGDGRFCYEMRTSGVELTGVDYSARAVAFARAFSPGLRFVAADLAEYDAGEPFDAAVCIETLEHIPPDRVPRFAEAAARNVRPGGRLVVSVPSTALPVAAKHYQHFAPSQLVDLFAPWCDVERTLGHVDARQWAVYNRMRSRAAALWPLRTRLPGAEWYLARFEQAFERIRITEPAHGVSVVAVFRRR